MVSKEEVAALVAEQVALIEDSDRRDLLLRLLVEPRVEEREWDYGEEGERYPYWVVAESPEHHLILVYCEQGFGPESPWGWLYNGESECEEELASLGMDAQWEWYLESALTNSGIWRGPYSPDEPRHLPPEKRFPDRHLRQCPASP